MDLNPSVLMSKKGAKLISVASIQPNRLNPNEMNLSTQLHLELDMKKGDYDPITISPMNVFYHEAPELITVSLEEAKERYIICDGEHRWMCAKVIMVKEIWAYVQYWTEKDAMAHFVKRQRLRGDLDPLKEAVLFQHEIKVNGRTRDQVISLYNISSMRYLKTRLAILKVADNVIELFYTQEEFPGSLSLSHLEHLSRLPNQDQHRVALMSLESNWKRDDLADEIRRIKEGRGTRRASTTVEAPSTMPGSRPTQAQQGLHPNIDELLKEWQEQVIRHIKSMTDKGVSRQNLIAKFCMGPLNVPRSTLSFFLTKMVRNEVLKSETLPGTGRGRRPIGYFLVEVAAEEIETEPKVTTAEEEIFKKYPKVEKPEEQEPTEEVSTDTVESEVEEVQEDSKVAEKVESQPGPPEVKKIPRSWTSEDLPSIVTMDILDTFAEEIHKEAVKEGFDLKSKKKIEGRKPEQWLIDEISESLDSIDISFDSDEPDILALKMIGLRACQLYYRLTRG